MAMTPLGSSPRLCPRRVLKLCSGGPASLPLKSSCPCTPSILAEPQPRPFAPTRPWLPGTWAHLSRGGVGESGADGPQQVGPPSPATAGLRGGFAAAPGVGQEDRFLKSQPHEQPRLPSAERLLPVPQVFLSCSRWRRAGTTEENPGVLCPVLCRALRLSRSSRPAASRHHPLPLGFGVWRSGS